MAHKVSLPDYNFHIKIRVIEVIAVIIMKSDILIEHKKLRLLERMSTWTLLEFYSRWCVCPFVPSSVCLDLLTSLLLAHALWCFLVLPLAIMCSVKPDGIPQLCRTDEIGELCVCAVATGTSYYGLSGMTKNTFEVGWWEDPSALPGVQKQIINLLRWRFHKRTFIL